MKSNSAVFWEEKYNTADTGWDMGKISPPLKEFFDTLEDKQASILIPGAGNAYEAAYLHHHEFTNVHVVEFSQPPIQQFKLQCPSFPKEHIHQIDFFTFKGEFDWIVEQTFFCAIPPERRDEYVDKTSNLLNHNGQLVGLLFDFPLTEEGPPYGGSKEEYIKRFKRKYHLLKLEKCYNSHPKRQGKEFFINFQKK